MADRVSQSVGSAVLDLDQSVNSATGQMDRVRKTVYCDPTSTAITLLASVSLVKNDIWLIIDVTGQAGNHAISFNPGAATLNGQSGVQSIISFPYGWARIKWTGTAFVLA